MVVVLKVVRKGEHHSERVVLAAGKLEEAEEEVKLLIATDPELELAELYSTHLVPSMGELREERRLKGQREHKEGRFAGG